MPRGRIVALALLAAVPSGVAAGQQPPPTGKSLAEAAARRFPQPVRVGDLLRRRVLRPVESQPTIGWVRDVVRRADGGVSVVMDYGGVLGLIDVWTRPVAVPVEAMALLGQYMEVVGLTPEQLDALPTYDGAGGAMLPPDSTVRVGLARPSH